MLATENTMPKKVVPLHFKKKKKEQQETAGAGKRE